MSEHYPGLFKRGKIWWFKTPGPDGKRIQRSTGKTAEREAIKVAKEIESKIAQNAKSAEGLPVAYQAILERASHEAQQGRLTLQRTETLVRDIHALANPDYNRVSLDQHLANWTEDQSLHVSARTVEIYGDMRRLMTEALGKRASSAPVDKLTTSQVKAAIRKIKVGKVTRQGKVVQDGRAAATTNLTLRAFRRAMEAAVQDNLVSANPAAQVRVYPETDSKVVAPFTKEEFGTLLRHVRGYYKHDEWEGAILIGGHAGLRFGDVLGLTRENVHDGRLVVETGKTGKVVEIPMTPPVVNWIGKKRGKLFPLLSDKGPGSLSTTFTRIMERAGVARDVELPGRDKKGRRSFHSLRHSFASWLADSDVHADVRKKLTGHTTDGIHQNYSHHDEALDRAMEGLPGA
jgi:integrase